MQPREKNGISTVIQKSAVWEDLVEYNKKSPFLTVPKKKKDEDMRKSVDRHLEAIENKLKNCFPEIQKDVIFQSVDNEYSKKYINRENKMKNVAKKISLRRPINSRAQQKEQSYHRDPKSIPLLST
jgi:hypothetical protein